MRVFFTGATGVLGRWAVPRLVAAGHEVVAVARSDRGATWLADIGAEPRMVDLFDPTSVHDVMGGVETVVHYATSIPPQKSMGKRAGWETNDRLRSHATSVLVDAAVANDVARFVQQSITFFYADGGDSWLDESAPIAPTWDVLESALDAEANVVRFGESGGIGVTLRLSRLYGPGRVSADYVASVAKRELPIVGDGQNYVSSLHVDDAATATLAALTVPAGTYNVSDDNPQRAADHTTTLAELLDAPTPRRVPRWLARLVAGESIMLLTTSQRISNSRFKEATGWKPTFPSAPGGWHDIVFGTGEADR